MENKKNSFIIRGNNIIGAPSVGYTELTYDQYLQMKDNDEIDLNKQYLVTCDEQTGTLLSAEDIAYNDETVKSKIDELDNTKLDKCYKSATDANDAIGEHGTNVFILSYTSANLPVQRTGVIRSFSYVQDNYIRVNQEFSTIDNSPNIGGTYKRYGTSDDGVTYTWSNWNFVASIDDSTTAALKTWSSSKIVEYVAENAAPSYSGTVIPTKIASGATVTTDWDISSAGSNADYGRLLMLNSNTGTFLIYVKGNLGNTSIMPTPTVISSIGSYQSASWSSSFELSISSGKLRIKNKSGAVASWRFV